MTTITTTTTTSRSAWGGDTSPRAELPRPATGAAISPTPPDTGRPTLPRAPRFRRCFAAIPASHLPVNALRPRSRPDYRTACATSRHHRRCSSVRSPAGVTWRRHGGRPATRHPHGAGLLRCRCGRPAAVFQIPSVAAPTAATRHCHGLTLAARACARHTGIKNRPATRRCAEDNQERTCGSPCQAVPVACAWWQPPVILTGTVPAASLPQRLHSGQRTGPLPRRLLACLCAHRRFHVPSVAAAVTCAVCLPHRRARAAAAVPPGRGLCAWIHAPARTPAVIAGCRHAAPAQHQC